MIPLLLLSKNCQGHELHARHLFSAATEDASGSIDADEFRTLIRLSFREDGQDSSPEAVELALTRARAWKISRLADEQKSRSLALVLKRRKSLLDAATLEDYSSTMQAEVHAQFDAEARAETEAQREQQREFKLKCRDFEEMVEEGAIQIAGIGSTMPARAEISVCAIRIQRGPRHSPPCGRYRFSTVQVWSTLNGSSLSRALRWQTLAHLFRVCALVSRTWHDSVELAVPTITFGRTPVDSLPGFDLLWRFPNVTSMTVSRSLSQSCLKALFPLRFCMETVRLVHADVGPAALVTISQALMWSGSNFRDAAALESSDDYCGRLHSLDISFNRLVDALPAGACRTVDLSGLRALAEAMRLGRLTALNLSNNQLDSASAAVLADLIRASRTLQRLDVSQNDLTDGGRTLVAVQKMAAAVARSMSLCSIKAGRHDLEVRPLRTAALVDLGRRRLSTIDLVIVVECTAYRTALQSHRSRCAVRLDHRWVASCGSRRRSRTAELCHAPLMVRTRVTSSCNGYLFMTMSLAALQSRSSTWRQYWTAPPWQSWTLEAAASARCLWQPSRRRRLQECIARRW